MKTSHMILSAASILPLLSSCASQQQAADNQLWSIKPVYDIRHATETPGGYYQLGRYYQGQRRYNQALAAYEKALALDGNFAEARNGMGVVYSMQGRNREAIEQFRLATELAPNAAHIRNNLGYALYLNKSYAEAVAVLDKAVSLDPANQSASTNLALALDKTGDKERAVHVLADAARQQQSAGDAPQKTEESGQVQTAIAAAPVVVTASLPSSTAPADTALPGNKDAVAQAATPPASKVDATVQTARVETKVQEAHVIEVPVQSVAAAESARQAAAPTKAPGAVVAQAAPRPAVQAVSAIQTAEMKPRAYEARTQTVVQIVTAAKPIQQVAQQKMGADTATAQAALKLIPAPELHVRNAPTVVVSAVARQTQAAASVAGSYRIEVSNGNGVTGMARKVAGFLQKEGAPRARLTNQKPFQVASSQVQYRSGYRDQAQSLAAALPGNPNIAQSGSLRGDVSVRVLLGKDMASNVANFEQGQGKVRLARIDAD